MKCLNCNQKSVKSGRCYKHFLIWNAKQKLKQVNQRGQHDFFERRKKLKKINKIKNQNEN